VHRDEKGLVLLFAVDLFALLTAYYVLKVVREPLILLGGGAVSRSYARSTQAVLLLAVIPAYSALANRIEPSRLVNAITLFFAGCLLAFSVLGRLGVPLGFVFFVWLGIFSTLAIAQFWSLANDLFTEEEGKRLFPLIAAGGTLGAIAGAQIAARGIGLVGPFGLMLAAAALLGACALLTRAAHVRALRRRSGGSAAPDRARNGELAGGFGLVLRDRYLLLIALVVLLHNLVNTTGDFILAAAIKERAEGGAEIGADIAAFYGDFQSAVSLLTALLQIFVVARIFRTAGVRRAIFILPVFAVFGYGLFAAAPALALMASVKVMENSADYSVQNTTQQALFLPTSRAAKYKAKAAIDTFFVRLGDLASGAVVFAGVQLGLGVRGFSLINVAAGLLWLAMAAALARRHRRLSTIDPDDGATRAARRPQVGAA
jgi:ATP:ADP antiporter, AAA family